MTSNINIKLIEKVRMTMDFPLLLESYKNVFRSNHQQDFKYYTSIYVSFNINHIHDNHIVILQYMS